MSEAAVTGQQIATTALEAYACKGGYIWGQMGATWTAAKQKSLEKRYNADPSGMASYKSSVQYGSKWIGHRVWDCAGLARWAAKEHGLAIHAGSNLIWDCDLAKKGKMTPGLQLPVGALVFTGTDAEKPHVGVYTGNGIVTEATGAKKGVIQSKLTDSKWKYWGLLKKVSYEFIPGQAEEQKPATDTGTTKLPVLRMGNKGTYVKKAQQLLQERGYSLGICGVDGDFGPATEKAVRQFQQDWGLTPVDGIIGEKTWEKLMSTPVKEKTYTVTIKGLSKDKATKLQKEYPGSIMKEE